MRYALTLIAVLMLTTPAAADPLCGSSITNTVTLTGPLVCGGNGYVMGSGGVLDCQWFSITGPKLPGSVGVRINGQTGVQVKRCTIQGFERGIYATNMTDSVLRRNTLQANTKYGAQVSGGGGNTLLFNAYLRNGDEGLHLSDLTLLGPTPTLSSFDRAEGNTKEGFYLLNVQNLRIEDCGTADNGGPGIYVKHSRVSIARCALVRDSLQVVDDADVSLTTLETE